MSGASGTGTITARAIAPVASANGRAYDGTAAAQASLAAGSSLVAGDVLNFAFTGASFANKNAGVGKTVTLSGISMSGADAGNYALSGSTATAAATITPKVLTVGGSAVDRDYDGSNVAAIAYTDDRVAGDVLTLGGTSTFASKNVGVNKAVTVSGIAATGADAQNYTLSTTNLSSAATVSQRQLVLGATAANREYNGSTAATVTLSDNRVAGDVMTVFAGGSFADKNVGTNKTVTVGSVSKIGTDAGNYALPSATLTTQANITPRAVDVFLNAGSRVYDGTLAATTTLSMGDNRVYGDSLSLSADAGTFANKNVGNSKQVTVNNIVLNGADAGNYQLTRTSATGERQHHGTPVDGGRQRRRQGV